MENVYLEYKEELKTDYTKNFVEIIYDKDNGIFKKIYFYNWEYGIIEVKNGKKETHKWETEDEAQSGSYLNRNFPILCLDGKINNLEVENKIIEENIIYIRSLNIKRDEMMIIDKAIRYIKELF